MKSTVIKVIMTAALLLTSGIGLNSALAEENSFADRIALAYAPENKIDDQRFEQFELHGEYEDAHELNDAWLGMPVRDNRGKIIGYVEDAFLDQEGYLTELLVSLNNSEIAVYIDQKYVDFTELAVLVDLPINAIASFEQERRIL